MRTKANRAKTIPTIHTTTIHAMSHDGRGISTHADGKTAFIYNALPGETVNFTLNKSRSRFHEGDMADIIMPSPDRTNPGCAHFGTCGGCSMQHMTMSAQIHFKQKVLLEQLCHFGHVEPEQVMSPIDGDAWKYRRKARLGVRFVVKKNKLLIGFRERSSRYLADISACEVLPPQVGKELPAIANTVMKLSAFDQIPQIEIAIGDQETALVFRHMTALTITDQAHLIKLANALNFSIYLQPNPPLPLTKLWPEDNNHQLTYQLPNHQLTMPFHPLDFIQVNGKTNLLMIDKALTLLELNQNDRVLDLFCGLGNFTLPMAKQAALVVGVEGSEAMVTRATQNAALNAITNTEFYAANLAEEFINKPAWLRNHYHKILIDPPRTGAKEIIPAIAELTPERIVYVSCNPATLARDAGLLVHNHGYRLSKVGVVNMFPHTSHIEAIAVFEK